jgi:hypothetical protein
MNSALTAEKQLLFFFGLGKDSGFCPSSFDSDIFLFLTAEMLYNFVSKKVF